MADVSYSVQKAGQGQDVSYLKKYVVLDTTVDDADTITVVELGTVQVVSIINLSDGSVIGSTLATNVITIDEAALSAAHVLVSAVGIA